MNEKIINSWLYYYLLVRQFLKNSALKSKVNAKNTRRGIPCLEATMCYFIYHLNTIAL